MELVRLTHENLEREHICCAISNNKDIQVSSKKAWLAERLDEGLVFLKGNVREMFYRVYPCGICMGAGRCPGVYVYRLHVGVGAVQGSRILDRAFG